MWNKAKPPLLWADNETVSYSMAFDSMYSLFLFKIKRSIDNRHKNGIGACFSQFCVRYPYAIPFTPKSLSVYGDVGLKCPEIGKNRA